MSRKRLTVVLSQAPGKHPAKRALEESLAAALLMEPGIDLSIVPNLYDLGPDHTGRLYLNGVSGDLLVLSWHFPRAVYWLLDRIGVKGHYSESQLKSPNADTEEDEGEAAPPQGIGAAGSIPDRHVYCLDLRDYSTIDPYVNEIRRVAAECRDRQHSKPPTPVQQNGPLLQLGLAPKVPTTPTPANLPTFTPEQLLTPPNRRWYPVIDYSRCTNCLECLDFCLFGVYGVDQLDRILVETQDNCKKGCPACSRVCPEQAIMFPEYKTAAIAGAPVGAISGLKIDLTKLFGGELKDALSQAVDERDRELVAAGLDAVGNSVGLNKRQDKKATGPKDDLDKLMDDLDALGL